MKKSLGALLLLAVACDSNGTGPSDVSTNVQVSFATQAVTPLASVRSVVYREGAAAATLVVTSAEIVLRKVQLKRTDTTDCDVTPEPEGCEEFEAGPFLVSLPVDGSVTPTFELDVPIGTYGELEFDIHKVSSSDPEDATFRAGHPDFVDLSIRVQGTYNGQPFEFTTDLDVEQELNLAPPLVIEEGSLPANITILVGLDDWFRDGSGNLIDPATGNKGGVNESRVLENIKKAIEAFEDDDRDGER